MGKALVAPKKAKIAKSLVGSKRKANAKAAQKAAAVRKTQTEY